MIRIESPVEFKKLSPAEVEILDRIYEKYRSFSQYQLGEITHNLPEYTDPGESSAITPLDKILRAIGYSQKDMERIAFELKEEAAIEAMFAG